MAAPQSIPHLADLPPGEALDVLRGLPRSTATEKLDGAALTAGVDADGRLFASREGKRPGSPRRYSPAEWPELGTNNQFRAAHAALEARRDDALAALRPGDTVELEVMLGDQPNTVAYSGAGDRIAILGGPGADALGRALGGSDAVAQWDELFTPDGKALETRGVSTRFRFEAPRRLPVDRAAPVAAEGEAALAKFLGEPSAVEGLTNLQLLDANLGSVPKERREEAAVAREAAEARLKAEHLTPLTLELLRALGAEGEGAVVTTPAGKLVKLVDRDGFTADNRAAQAHLAAVRAPIRSTDPDAPEDQRGGLIGRLRLDLADMLGNRDLARPAGARAALEPHGPDPVGAIEGLAAELAVPDYQGLRQAAAHKVRAAAAELEASRRRLLEAPPPELGEPQVARVLLAHAEARRDLAELLRRLGSAPTVSDFLSALYGREARALAPAEAVTEARRPRAGAKGEVDVGTYAGLDAWALVHTYVAAALASALIVHVGDRLGLRLLRDRKSSHLRRWSTDMSPLNHWGYPIWRADTAAVRKLADDKALRQVARATKSIPERWWHNLHMDLSYDGGVTIEWGEHRRTLRRLVDLSGTRTERVNSLIDRVVGWPELSLDERARAYNALYLFTQQFIPRSALFARVRALGPTVLLSPPTETTLVTDPTNLLAILEDAAETATAAADVAPLPVRVGLGRRQDVIRRARSPEAAALKRKFTDPRKARGLREATGDAAQALRQADGSDAGSTDLAQKGGQEVTFSAMRNAINTDGGVTGADVIDYLERAAELNNEVDTVGFVVKDAAGENVEIYVNAKDADQFATEMADLLGRDNDVEAALNDVAQRVDIVDVVWPDADDPRNDPDPQPDDLDLDAALDPTDEEGAPTPPPAAKVAGAVPTGTADVLRALATAASKLRESAGELTPEQEAEIAARFERDYGSPLDKATDAQLDEFEAKASRAAGWTAEMSDFVLDHRGQEAARGRPDDRVAGDDGARHRVAEAFGRKPTTSSAALSDEEIAELKALFMAWSGGYTPGECTPSEIDEFVASHLPGKFDEDAAFHYLTHYNSALDEGAQPEDTPMTRTPVGASFLARVTGQPAQITEAAGWYVRGADGATVDGPLTEAVATQMAEMLGEGFVVTEARGKKRADTDGIRDGLNMQLDSQTRALVGRLTRPLEKRIVGLFSLVGIPGRYLTADGIEDGVRAGADKLFPVGSATSRAFSAFYEALAQIRGVTAEAGPADAAGDAKRGSFLQKLLESVLIELGLPAELVVTGGPGPVGAALYRTVKSLAGADGAERALRDLGRRLGVSAADAMAPVAEARKPVALTPEQEKAVIKDFKEWSGGFEPKDSDPTEINQYVKYARDANLGAAAVKRFLLKAAGHLDEGRVTEAVDVGTDDFAEAVVALATALGVPEANLNFRKAALVQSLRAKKNSLTNRATVLSRMKVLAGLVESGTRGGAAAPEADDQK
jgi:hypothetical protein